MQDHIRKKLYSMMKKHGSALIGGVNVGGDLKEFQAMGRKAKQLGETNLSQENKGNKYRALKEKGLVQAYIDGDQKWSYYLRKKAKVPKVEMPKAEVKEIIKEIAKELPIELPKEEKKEIAENIMHKISDRMGMECYSGVDNLYNKLHQMKNEEDLLIKNLAEKELNEKELVKLFEGSGKKKKRKPIKSKLSMKKKMEYVRSFKTGAKKKKVGAKKKKLRSGLLSLLL